MVVCTNDISAWDISPRSDSEDRGKGWVGMVSEHRDVFLLLLWGTIVIEDEGWVFGTDCSVLRGKVLVSAGKYLWNGM